MHSVFIEASLNNWVPGKREIGGEIVETKEDALPYYWENLWKRGGLNVKCFTLVSLSSILKSKAKYGEKVVFEWEWREQFAKEIGPLQRTCDAAVKEQVGRLWSANQLVCGIGSSLPKGKRFAIVSTNYAHFVSAPLSAIAFSEADVNANKPRVLVNFDNHQDYYAIVPKQASKLPDMGKRTIFRPTPALYGNWAWKPENGGWGAFHTHIAHTMWGPPYPPTCYCALGCNNTGSVLSYVEYNVHGQIDADNSYIDQRPGGKDTNGGSAEILNTLNAGLRNKDWQLYVTLDRDVLSSAVTHFRNHSTCTMAGIKQWLKAFCDAASSIELVGADITGLPREGSTIADHMNAVNDIISFHQAIMSMAK